MNTERRQRIRQMQILILKIIWAVYCLFNANLHTGSYRQYRKKKRGGIPSPPPPADTNTPMAAPFSTHLPLFRDWDFYRDIVQTAKAKESQRGLWFLRKEYQKNVPKEIKPQIINSKSTNQTSEESKDVRNLLRGLIWLKTRWVASHAFL